MQLNIFYDFMYNGYCWRYGQIFPALIYRRFIFETRSVGGVLALTAYNVSWYRCVPYVNYDPARQHDFLG